MKQTTIKDVILKVSSRCNLACDYCYMYELDNKAKDFWLSKQPAFFSDELMTLVADKLAAYWKSRGVSEGHIVFHGGEPLLVGSERLDRWLGILAQRFGYHEQKVRVALQTNGILLDKQMLEVLSKWNVMVGVSIDGRPSKHDQHRNTALGRPSGALALQGINLLRTEYSHIFSGLLCVIDVDHDPVEVTEFLLSLSPPSIDFLLPLDNWDRLPKRPAQQGGESAYGEWLSKMFDVVLLNEANCSVRVISELLGRAMREENSGALMADDWSVTAILPDGGVELLDTFAASDVSLKNTSANIKNDDFFVVESTLGELEAQMQEALQLSEQCKSCDYLSICGGGNIHSRYSTEAGYKNPSVYCADIKLYIDHGIRYLGGKTGQIVC
jgi:uncharacterized protein